MQDIHTVIIDNVSETIVSLNVEELRYNIQPHHYVLFDEGGKVVEVW